ncbi:MAG: hypothetical protein A2Y00_07125 [Omnitrophica WOR_2 bacterium GWF2_43_52]|nr:MAG: hypothetical protein A2Y01_07785 [Omnitrophica WOR_2 bacterium GWC2_44_8]OGX20194.1 MAG: hypothetical protein A2Y00_07125 [Omnitrophica WOR_2 bacterium GWF2_43_52]OGX58028.1 MAG: hypothetical protein A2460_02030 [Omnitrophica WOR_2 bacterium RIFOXYC2_FULL_43_9]HAH19319.1 hypothetical protein [Candidatus Omnitrophota bacterium]HBG63658.1 hypothetical protein [Candidatus Omnitrophota bacterium]
MRSFKKVLPYEREIRNTIFSDMRIILFANILITCAFFIENVHSSVLFHGFFVSILIFFFPGFLILAGISRGKGKRDALSQLFTCIIISTLLLIGGGIIHIAGNLRMDIRSYIWYLVLMINLILIASFFFKKKTHADTMKTNLWKGKRIAGVMSVIAVLFFAYVLFFWLAVDIIPPLQDNTLTTQSTAYGLSVYFIPKTFTDRYISYEFAHPLLMHFYTAGVFSLTGNLEKVRYYYDYANEFEELSQKKFYKGEYIDLSIQNFGARRVRINEVTDDKLVFDAYIPQLKPNPRLLPIEKSSRFGFIKDNNVKEDYMPILNEDSAGVNSLPIDVIRKGEYWKMARKVYRLFYNTPYLYPSRLPNIVFTLMSLLSLYYLLSFISQSRILAGLGVVAFGTIPELLIRSLGGSTTSISIFAMLLIMYFYSIHEQKALFAAAFFAGLVEHKIIVILISLCIFEFIVNKRRLGNYRLSLSAVAGFIGGIGVYWMYGLFTNSHVFLQDHFRYHFINRIFHVADLGYTGYPGIGMLWVMFIKQAGLLLVFPAFFAMFSLFKVENQVFCKLYPLCFACGAIAFSVVDWRSTKHLVLLTPALVASLFLYISLRGKQRSIGIICVIIAASVLNSITLMRFIQRGDMQVISAAW